MRFAVLLFLSLAACQCGPKPQPPKVPAQVIGGKDCPVYDNEGCHADR